MKAIMLIVIGSLSIGAGCRSNKAGENAPEVPRPEHHQQGPDDTCVATAIPCPPPEPMPASKPQGQPTPGMQNGGGLPPTTTMPTPAPAEPSPAEPAEVDTPCHALAATDGASPGAGDLATGPEPQAGLYFFPKPGCYGAAISHRHLLMPAACLTAADAGSKEGHFVWGYAGGGGPRCFQLMSSGAPAIKNNLRVGGHDLAIFAVWQGQLAPQWELPTAHDTTKVALTKRQQRFTAPDSALAALAPRSAAASGATDPFMPLPFRGYWGLGDGEAVLGSEAQHLCSQDLGSPLIYRHDGRSILLGMLVRPVFGDDDECQQTAHIFSLVSHPEVRLWLAQNGITPPT